MAQPVGAELGPGTFWDQVADLLEPDDEQLAHLPTHWRGWVTSMFPRATAQAFAEHHEEFWDWIWSIELHQRRRPFVGVWPRGGGKSTNAELGVVAVGARMTRRYAIYVSSTQDQADKRVENIGAFLEAESVQAHYPALGRRALGKYGKSKGWRRNRLRTSSGFTVDALGLDVAARGAKVDEQRPDLIILDDIDERHDSEDRVKRKMQTLTDTILPMGSADVAVIVLQNLIIPHGIVAALASGEADYLVDRHVSGPVPAIYGLKTEPEERSEGVMGHRIVGGIPSWEGQDLDACQWTIDMSGLPSFLREQQHEVDEVEGALWTRDLIRRGRPKGGYRRIVIAVDPSGGAAEIGIIACGLSRDGTTAYVIRDATQPGHLGPLNWGRKVVEVWDALEADRVVAESNFGGDMVTATIQAAGVDEDGRTIPVHLVRASRGKVVRAEPILAFYQQGSVYHAGVFPELESEMTRWVPGVGPSPNRLDAVVFALTELLLPEGRTKSGRKMRPPGI